MYYIILLSVLFVGSVAYLLVAGASIVKADDEIQDGIVRSMRES